MKQSNNNNNGYRWFKLGIAAGSGLALLLLFTSISNYRFVSRRIVMEQTRRDIAKLAAELDQQMREPGAANAAALLEEARTKNGGRVAWMELRDMEGRLRARSGSPASPTFSASELRERFRNRQPVFKTRATEAGEAVVEIQPVRLPEKVWGTIEVALLPGAVDASLWPIRRNLIINSSGALALLAALALMALRFRSYVRGRHLAQQLEVAREVQRNLLPPACDAGNPLDLAAAYSPASDVSGDFYDVQTGAEGEYSIVLGDVSGKGVPAALLMGVIHGAVRSANWTDSRRAHEEATRRLNQLLCERASKERYATLFWAYWDPRTTLLHFINAGHFAPMLVTEEGKLVRLEDGGPVLGLLPFAQYRQGSVRIRPGDLLVLFTDGIIEARDQSGEEFGEDRIARIVLAHRDRPVEQIRAALLEATAGLARDDDQTVVILRHKAVTVRRIEPVAAPAA